MSSPNMEIRASVDIAIVTATREAFIQYPGGLKRVHMKDEGVG